MPRILKLKYPETGNIIHINDTLIFNAIRIAKSRDKGLYSNWINKMERLYKRKITDEDFEY